METEHTDIDAILCAAIELATPQERQAYIDRACGDDAEKRTRVHRLLAAHERAGSFLESPAPGLTVLATSARASRIGIEPGSTIGDFQVLKQIGEGGIGIVFLAEQLRPVRRKVALKVIKLGMDTRQVIARFEAERQALAIMNHPNVAKIFDAGATETGRPYFVMELVEGVSVTEYCDQSRLTIANRLELFVQVCRALEHAHQKGLIHRDIKPSNVLVCIEDGRPCAKVIDFGIAKATQQQSVERTVFTETQQLIGTPQYMSPEQADGSLDIDTRTDVYSLGVLLYELLTGTTPFEGSELRSKAYSEMQRIIREVDPLTPSTRLSKLHTIASVAAQRSTEPRHLNATVRGELDWIVMKCLEKDRRRRYESANGLALDVQRYLGGEAVLAVPASRAYRFSKFVRRYKGAVIAVSTILVLLVAGVVGTTAGLIGQRRALQRATLAAAAEKTAKETAQARDAESRAVLDFVQNKIFAAARPQGQEGGLGRDVTLRKAVEAALPFVETSFKDHPLTEARLRMTMGSSFFYLGDAKTALGQFEAARVLSEQQLGPDHPSTLAAMSNVALMYGELGRPDEALKLRQEALARQKATLGPDDPATLRSMLNLANCYHDLGREAEALALREQTLPLMKSKLGPDHPLTISSMNNLALSYEELGRLDDALKLREETLAITRAKLGPDHVDTIAIMNGLATSYSEAGRDADALKLREETLALAKAKLGIDHPLTLWAMNNLAISYQTAGRQAEALALREEVLTRRRAVIGADHPDTLDAMHNLAFSYAKMGRQEEALKLREEVLEKRKTALGEDHPDTLRSMTSLADSYQALGRNEEALELYRKTLAIRKAKLGPRHPDTIKSEEHVAHSLELLHGPTTARTGPGTTPATRE